MPNLRYELHHKICNVRYGTPVMGWMPIKEETTKCSHFQYLVVHLPEFHLWVLPLVTRIDGFSQLGYCMLLSLG